MALVGELDETDTHEEDKERLIAHHSFLTIWAVVGIGSLFPSETIDRATNPMRCADVCYLGETG